MADIHKLMTLTGGDKVANQMYDQMEATMKASGGPSGVSVDAFLKEFRKEIDFKQIEDIVIASYDHYLSADDVKALVAFYETTAGHHMIEAMPKISGEMMSKIMPLSQDVAQRVIEKMKTQGLPK